MKRHSSYFTKFDSVFLVNRDEETLLKDYLDTRYKHMTMLHFATLLIDFLLRCKGDKFFGTLFI